MRSALYVGHIWHERRTPVRRAFRYRVFMWWLDADEIGTISRRLAFGRKHPLFGEGPGHLISFRATDHLGERGHGIKENAAAFLATMGLITPLGRVMVLTNARVFGYAFNPISLLYCYDQDDHLLAVIAEVHNTFGQRHCYLIPADEVERHEQAKEFYVSPFLDVSGRYRMRVPVPGQSMHTTVTLEQNGIDVFHAALSGQRRAINRRSVTAMLVAYPLLTFRITALIHWQALHLWVRRVALVPRPHHERQEHV